MFGKKAKNETLSVPLPKVLKVIESGDVITVMLKYRKTVYRMGRLGAFFCGKETYTTFETFKNYAHLGGRIIGSMNDSVEVITVNNKPPNESDFS